MPLVSSNTSNFLLQEQRSINDNWLARVAASFTMIIALWSQPDHLCSQFSNCVYPLQGSYRYYMHSFLLSCWWSMVTALTLTSLSVLDSSSLLIWLGKHPSFFHRGFIFSALFQSRGKLSIFPKSIQHVIVNSLNCYTEKDPLWLQHVSTLYSRNSDRKPLVHLLLVLWHVGR